MEKRQLAYTVMDKPRRQTPVADSKTVNARVDKAWYGVIRGTNPLRVILGETCLSVSLPTMGGAQLCSKGKTG